MPVTRLLAAVCCLGLVTLARAQQSPVRIPNTVDAAMADLPRSPLIRKALVDSLNRRPPNWRQLPVLQQARLPAAGFNDLQDPLRGQFLSYIQASSGAAKFAQLQQGFGVLKDSARMERFLDDKLRGFYALAKDHPAAGNLQLPGKPENKLQKAGAQTSYGDTTGNASGWWSNVEVQDRFALGAIPVNLQYANVSGYSQFGHDLSGENLGNLKFDREAYLQKVSSHLKKNYDLKKYFLDDIDFKAQLKQFAAVRMKSLAGTGDSLAGLIRPEDLIYLDSAQLRNQLLANASGDSVRRYGEQELNDHLAKLLQLQKELGGSLDVNTMLNRQAATRGKLNDFINDPASAADMAGNMIPLSGLQRLFLKVRELNVGNIAANASKGTVSDLFMTGAAGSLFNKSKFMMLGAGKTRQALPYDMGLEGGLTAPSQSLQFLRMGRGELGGAHQHVSLMNANARRDGRMPDARVLKQNIFAGALSNRFSFGDYGVLDFEISKSNNSTTAAVPGGDHAAVSKAAIAHFFDDFFVTLSTGLRYSGEVPDWGTTHSVYFNYSGLGYNNPGNPYARRGMLSYGVQLKRSWLKNKASVQLRTDFRDMARSALSGSQWKNRTLALDGRYRMSKQLTLGARLHESTMHSTGDHGKDEVFVNRKITFNSQWNARMGGLRFFNQSALGMQQLHYLTAAGPLKSLFLNTHVSHTIPLGERMITANVFYNRDVRDAAIYGNLLTVDAGYHYRLWKVLQCGSSLTFLDNRSVVSQAGIRQQLSAVLLRRCQVNLSLDARKSFMDTPQNYLYGNFRSELSFFYLLN